VSFVDQALLEIARTLGASMVLVGVAALGVGMVALIGSRMGHDPRIMAAARFAGELSVGGAVLGITGGVVGIASHWRAGAASTWGTVAGELSLVVCGAAFGVAMRWMSARQRDRG
jgi:hypothetical protein